MNKKKVLIAVSGASGSIYAESIFKHLEKKQVAEQCDEISVVFTKNAIEIWKSEIGKFDIEKYNFRFYENNNFSAPFASGSGGYDTMIIVPCSAGLMSRIACGISNDLITRAADVMLKERQKLILVLRETPLNLIHINNMKTITEAGGIIFPASPSFYFDTKNISQLADNLTERILELASFNIDMERWGSKM